jgi:hypothetical protein
MKMTTYRYANAEETVVSVFDDDGISRMSMLAELVPEGETIEPFVPPDPVPPMSVTMRQGRLALLGAGLLDSIESSIAAIEDATQRKAAEIEWEYAQTIDRNSLFVQQMAVGLELSEEQLDSLFLQASTL